MAGGAQGGRHLSRDVNKHGVQDNSVQVSIFFFVGVNYMRKVYMAVYRRTFRHSKGALTARLCHGLGGPPPALAWRTKVAGEGEVEGSVAETELWGS